MALLKTIIIIIITIPWCTREECWKRWWALCQVIKLILWYLAVRSYSSSRSSSSNKWWSVIRVEEHLIVSTSRVLSRGDILNFCPLERSRTITTTASRVNTFNDCISSVHRACSIFGQWCVFETTLPRLDLPFRFWFHAMPILKRKKGKRTSNELSLRRILIYTKIIIVTWNSFSPSFPAEI